jgi:large subunit ribosomal protein L10
MANLTKAKKIEISKKIKDEFLNSDIILLSFESVGFSKLQELRDKLKPLGAKMVVMRNSIVYFASKEAGLLNDEKKPSLLKGPTAVVFIKNQDEISTISKILIEFSKENPQSRLKGGFLSKEQITPEIIKQISSVGSKKELLGKLVGTLYASLYNMRSVVEAPIRDLVYVLEALKEKKEKGN